MICTSCKQDKASTEFYNGKTIKVYGASLLLPTNECKSCERTRKEVARKRDRKLVLEHYGGVPPKCQCCGEVIDGFLTLDHEAEETKIAKQNESRRSGTVLYQWLVSKEFPPGYAVLCFNCNCAKGIYGICPHQKPLNLYQVKKEVDD